MTVKELRAEISKAMETMVQNRYTCTSTEKEILKATYSKKADLEKQLSTFQTVIKRNEDRIEKQKASAKASATEKASASEKKTETKAVASLKKSSKTKKTEKVSLYPVTYETTKSKLTKVAFDLAKLESGETVLGRYFDIKSMSKSLVYSFKEKDIQKALESLKKEGKSPFPCNIDLYKVVAKNDELFVLQSIITTSFTSIRKDDIEKAVKADSMALYTMEEKPAEKKPAEKKTRTKKSTK